MAHKNHNYIAHAEWNKDNGDRTHRLNYNLNKDSVVFDVGTFEGNWAQEIFNRYGCNILCFEPVPQYAAALKEKFKSNTKIEVFDFGLGGQSETVFMDADGDGATYKESGQEVFIKGIVEFLDDSNIKHVDLIKLNIEAAEYDLMDALLKSGRAEVFDHYQIQFHPFIDDYKERHDAIVKKLLLTHKTSYSYEYIWEGFEKIKYGPAFGSEGGVKVSEK